MSSRRTTIDFGTRVISDRGTSKIIAIPKAALENLAQGKFNELRFKLISENGQKFLELTPVFELEMIS